MKVRYLIYTGREEKGVLTVRQLSALHPLRKFNFTRGQRWRLDYDIPDQIGEYIKGIYGSIFKIIEEEISEMESFTSQFVLFLETYGKAVSPEELIENIFNFTIEHSSKAINKSDLFSFSFNAFMDSFFWVERDIVDKVIAKRITSLAKKKAKKVKEVNNASKG